MRNWRNGDWVAAGILFGFAFGIIAHIQFDSQAWLVLFLGGVGGWFMGVVKK